MPRRELTNREYDLAERLCDIRHAVDRGEDGIGVVGENDGCPACRAAVIALVDNAAPPPTDFPTEYLAYITTGAPLPEGADAVQMVVLCPRRPHDPPS